MDAEIGFFGKLPSHGDFIERGLPGDMLQALDAWLQQALAVSREQLGEQWLDVYLTSPVWHFALADGCLDAHPWLGLLLPSVDRVGRYFPLVIARRLPARAGPATSLLAAQPWLAQLERLALDALQRPLRAEELATALAALPAPAPGQVQGGAGPNSHGLSTCDPGSRGETTREQFAALLDWQCRQGSAAGSLWHSSGSDAVAPCLNLARGMPDAAGFAAMLDGQWQRWGWEPGSVDVS